MKKIYLIAFLAISFGLGAQNIGINSSGATPNSSTILDLNTGNNWTGSNGKGMLMPCMNTASQNAIVSPAIGLMIFNTDCLTLNYWNGTSWIVLGNPTNPASPGAAVSIPSTTQIIWNWNATAGATGYQWNTSNVYPGFGVNTVTSPAYTQTGLTCNIPDTLYVWSYNACGISTSYTMLTQTTSHCAGPTCGKQIWATVNLNVGTEINVSSGNQAANQKYCYNDLPANCGTYGGLYEWATAMNSPAGVGGYSNTATNTINIDCDPCTTTSTPKAVQGICPAGYHIPSDLEWSRYEYCLDPSVSLATYQTTNGLRGTTVANQLKAVNPSWDGTNTSGFGALPGGAANSVAGSVYGVGPGTTGYYLTSTEVNGGNTWARELDSGNGQSKRYNPASKVYGNSVRCLQN